MASILPIIPYNSYFLYHLLHDKYLIVTGTGAWGVPHARFDSDASHDCISESVRDLKTNFKKNINKWKLIIIN